MHVCIELFKSFFKIGAFTIGGGYAMIPLFEDEFVNKKKWLTDEDFLNMLTITSAAPGPLAVNCAVYTGFRVAGFWGAVISVIGVIFSPIVVILLIAMNYEKFMGVEFIKKMFIAIRPAVVGLMVAAVYKLARRNNFKPVWYIVSILAFVLIALMGIDPFIILLVAGVSGLIFNMISERAGV
ncbi:MAG: chromate transporter [Eubacteriaceae bacterium]|nr:chromate transporter [Eubacteriaceae bacterium]